MDRQLNENKTSWSFTSRPKELRITKDQNEMIDFTYTRIPSYAGKKTIAELIFVGDLKRRTTCLNKHDSFKWQDKYSSWQILRPLCSHSFATSAFLRILRDITSLWYAKEHSFTLIQKACFLTTLTLNTILSTFYFIKKTFLLLECPTFWNLDSLHLSQDFISIQKSFLALRYKRWRKLVSCLNTFGLSDATDFTYTA